METDFTRESTQLRFQRCRQRKANPPAQLLVPRGVSGWVSLQGPVHVWGPRFTGGRKPVESQQPVQRERDTTPSSGMGTGTCVGSPRGASNGHPGRVTQRCRLCREPLPRDFTLLASPSRTTEHQLQKQAPSRKIITNNV